MNKLKQEQMLKPSLFQRMTKKNQNIGIALADVNKQTNHLKHQIFNHLIQVPRQNPKCSVAIEFESAHIFSEDERNFAFACGDNGLTRLPTVLKLPAKYENFDVETFNANLYFDLNYSVASKAEKNSYDYKEYE